MSEGRPLDLLVVGAGPTGIAIGAEARKADLDVLLVDRGALTAAILDFPTHMVFFTTRDLLEIADMPLPIPHEKPNRREALAYYRAVAHHYRLPVASYEEVTEVRPEDGEFVVVARTAAGERIRRARAVALATGYFHNPVRLGVPGEEEEWVHVRYREPDRHFDEEIVVIGGGNSACEAALDLWRTGARVTLVHRAEAVKETVKYWLKPDVENRIAEGSIAARFRTRVTGFADHAVHLEGPEGASRLPADAAYVLIGYLPNVDLQRSAGVEVDPETLVPRHDPETCESNVPGLYIAGTLQAGRDTGKIFIENSRDHGARIVRHLLGRGTA